MSSHDLSNALRKARLAEAAHFDAVSDLTDAQTLRLQVLKDELDILIAATPEAAQAFDLALIPGAPPRLWLDLISSVVMEPDSRNYQLQQDRDGARVMLFEASDRGQFIKYLESYLAHRIILRSKSSASATAFAAPRHGYSGETMFFAWLSGFLLGMLCLLIVSMLLGFLKF